VVTDTELVQELRQLRDALERLRTSIDSATSAGTTINGDDGSDIRGRGQQIAALLEELNALYQSEAISDNDYETSKEKLLARLVAV
jgi:predicted RND superfamily exporter protein